MLPEIYTTKSSAKFLDCAEQTLKQSRVTGKLFGVPAPKFIKLGNSVRYKRETLQAWCDQFTEVSNTGETR